MTLGSLLGARSSTSTLAPLPPIAPFSQHGHPPHPPYYRNHHGGQDRGDWGHHESEGYKGHGHKDKGKDAALSALTLLAFLFFLHILQSCLQDMTYANQAPVMMMTGGAAAPGRSPGRGEQATLVAVPVSAVARGSRSRRGAVRVDDMDAVTAPGNTAQELTGGMLSLETLPEDEVPIGRGVDGSCEDCSEEDGDVDDEDEDVSRHALDMATGIFGNTEGTRAAVHGIVSALKTLHESTRFLGSSATSGRRVRRSTAEEQARHLSRVAEQRRQVPPEDPGGNEGWEMVSVRRPTNSPSPSPSPSSTSITSPTLYSPDGQLMVQIPVQVIDKAQRKPSSGPVIIHSSTIPISPEVMVPVGPPPTRNAIAPDQDVLEDSDEDDWEYDKEGAGEGEPDDAPEMQDSHQLTSVKDSIAKNKQEEYDLNSAEAMGTPLPPTTTSTQQVVPPHITVVRPVAVAPLTPLTPAPGVGAIPVGPIPAPGHVLTFVPLGSHLGPMGPMGGPLGGSLGGSFGRVALRALGLVARPLLRLIQPGPDSPLSLCCDVVVCEARRLGRVSGTLGERVASTVSSVVSWACGEPELRLEFEDEEEFTRKGCRQQIQQCERRAGRRTAVSTIASILESYFSAAG